MIAIALALGVVGVCGVAGLWDIFRRRGVTAERHTDVLAGLRQKLEGMSASIEELQAWQKKQTTSDSARALLEPRTRPRAS